MVMGKQTTGTSRRRRKEEGEDEGEEAMVTEEVVVEEDEDGSDRDEEHDQQSNEEADAVQDGDEADDEDDEQEEVEEDESDEDEDEDEGGNEGDEQEDEDDEIEDEHDEDAEDMYGEADDEVPEKGVLSVKSAKGMANVMQGILSSTAKDVDTPVMAKDKSTLRKIVEQQEEERLTQQQIRAKRAKIDIKRVKPDQYNLNHEKLLRKMATKGAVALFNAVREHQKAVLQAGAGPLKKKSDNVAAMSKTDFLSMLSSKTHI